MVDWGGGAAGLARHLFSDPALRGFNVGAANTETNAKQVRLRASR